MKDKKKPKILDIKKDGTPIIESSKQSKESIEELKARYRKEQLNDILNMRVPDYDKRINESETEKEALELEKKKKRFIKVFTDRKE